MTGRRYRIRVKGVLRADWSQWFAGLQLCSTKDGETTLSGCLDQAALHGVLARIRDLGLELVAVESL
jgi:hypothetical protein